MGWRAYLRGGGNFASVDVCSVGWRAPVENGRTGTTGRRRVIDGGQDNRGRTERRGAGNGFLLGRAVGAGWKEGGIPSHSKSSRKIQQSEPLRRLPKKDAPQGFASCRGAGGLTVSSRLGRACNGSPLHFQEEMDFEEGGTGREGGPVCRPGFLFRIIFFIPSEKSGGVAGAHSRNSRFGAREPARCNVTRSTCGRDARLA